MPITSLTSLPGQGILKGTWMEHFESPLAGVLPTVRLAALLSEAEISMRYAVARWVRRSAGALFSEKLGRDLSEQFRRVLCNLLCEMELGGFTFLLQQEGK